MTRSGWALIAGSSLAGLSAGWVLAGWAGAATGAVACGLLGVLAVRIQMRALVALALIVSLAIGAIIGQGIVHALCLPDGCVAAESVAAVVTAVAAVIAMGLVVALVTRSFEEYNEAVAARRPPPEPGCETGEAENGTA